MALSVEHLSRYLSTGSSIRSMMLASVEADEINQPLAWNGATCLVVLCYVMKFISNSDIHGILIDTIRRLNDLASECGDLLRERSDKQSQDEKEIEISEMFVNSFMPEVLKFFRVPKLHQLSEKDKSLEENEILAGFIDFLLQILDTEALSSLNDDQMYGPLREELKFVVTILGDIPFQCTELQQVKNILAEFGTVADEAGGFIYSCVFSTLPVKDSMFYGSRDSLLKNVGILIEKIKEHCIKFSQVSRFTTPRKNVDDSLFIVDSLLEDLQNVTSCRFDVPIDDIIDQIKEIHGVMLFARSFLKNIEVEQEKYKDDVKECSVQIRDVAYEAEYLVNSYVIRNIPIWYMNLRLPTVIQRMKLIRTRLQESKKIYDLKVIKVEENLNRKFSLKPVETHVDDNIVVGFEDEKIKILGDLTGGSENCQIISIFGLPGLGKTTMAKKLYNDRLSYDYFDERAWCVVSQTYQKRNVLIGIFMSFALSKSEKTAKDKIMKMEDESLGLEIHKRLKGRRYLIILDDVWHSKMLDDLRRYFPDDANGSRIILTSRIKDTAPTGSIFHPLRLLSEVQCWELLEKKVFLEKPCPPQLLDIGKGIAAKCCGLPLAVVIISGILAESEKEENAWIKVEGNLDSYIFDDPSGCLKTLELSYDYLPNHLRRCFLYFGAFSQDAEIRIRKLVWLWIAEGFIPKHEHKSPENVAEEYLIDLINRSLVMIVKRRFDGGIKACSIHDLLHDMCLRKAHEENFMKSIKEEFSIFEKHQRLSIDSTINNFRSFGLHCRSFLGRLPDLSPGFSHMPLLRVIDLLQSEIISYDLDEIYLLVNLRYLSIHELPHPIVDSLVNLETLCFEYSVELKLSFILKMVKLEHLHTKSLFKIKKDCDTYQTTNLKSLGCVYIYNQEGEEILWRSPYLRKLKCIYRGTLFPDLCSLTQLESLNMSFYGHFKGESKKIYFPSTIKKLSLSGAVLPWEALSIIGRLPNLYYLSLASKAFAGEKWVTKDGEFRELRFFTIYYSDLKQWSTWSEHFPKLQVLVLRGCQELQKLPSDLGDISTLQTMEVSNCSYEASISAIRIEKEQHEYGNEEFKVIINNSHWSKEQLMRECEEE